MLGAPAIHGHGKPLDENTVYTVLLGEDVYVDNEIYCNCPMPEDLKTKREEQYVGEYNCIYMSGTLGVAWGVFFPYLFLLYLTPIFSVLYGFTGISINHVTEEEN